MELSHQGENFLSCLYGSERQRESLRLVAVFLSCLYGSEPARLFCWILPDFLSCLYGSALEGNRYSALFQKRITLNFAPIPFFIVTNQASINQ